MTAFELAAGASVLLSVGILVGMFRLRDAHPGNPSPTMAHLDYGLLLALAALMILARVLYSEKSAGHKAQWAVVAALTTFGLMVNIGRGGHLAFAGGRGAKSGFAAAITMVVFIFVAIMTLLQFRYTQMWEEVGENV